MANQKTLDILKGAILLERRGRSFYESTAQQAQNSAIREVFSIMAAEEKTHIEFLSRHYASIIKNGTFAPVTAEKIPTQISNIVLNKDIRTEIAAAGYEAAAISAAIAMEERAVKYYSEQANTTQDAAEKELYQWLADWEKTHFKILSDLDNELKENVWHDNQFWPSI